MRVLFWSARRRQHDGLVQELARHTEADIVILSEVRIRETCQDVLLSAPTDYLPASGRKLAAWSRHGVEPRVVGDRLLVFRSAGMTCVAIVPPHRAFRPRELASWQGYRDWWAAWPDHGFGADLVIGDFNIALARKPRSIQGRLPYARLGPTFSVYGREAGHLDYFACRTGIPVNLAYRPPPPSLSRARGDRPMLVVDLNPLRRNA